VCSDPFEVHLLQVRKVVEPRGEAEAEHQRSATFTGLVGVNEPDMPQAVAYLLGRLRDDRMDTLAP
jgi:hypothetical protein